MKSRVNKSARSVRRRARSGLNTAVGSYDPLVRAAMSRNVKYIEGVPRSIADWDRVYEVTIPSALTINTFSAGSITASLQLNPVSIVSTFSRFAAVFAQYLVAKIVVVNRILTIGTAQGEVWTQIVEDSASPSGILARQQHGVVALSAASDTAKNSVTMVWQPMSAEDVTWTSTGTGLVAAYSRLYADTTNTGTAAGDSSTKISTEVYFQCLFRYLA